MFDSSKSFVVPINSGGRKECKVRFPSDAEWCERARKQRSIRRFLGRGKSESEVVDTSATDADLFARIRVDQDGPVFDEAEAAAVLAKLERTSIESCEREGDHFRIALKVPGALTEHLVRMPTVKEMDAHETSSVRITGARRAQEVRGFLEPSGELYDAIQRSATGYDSKVPIVHKAAVVGEVLIQLASDDEDAIPEA